MYFNLKYVVSLLGLAAALSYCENDHGFIDPVLVENDKYYQIEIIPEDLQDLYGVWEVKAISGGFTGRGHAPDFDYIEIVEIGIFKIYRNDSLLTYGKISIDEEDGESVLVFHADPGAPNIPFYTSKRRVDLRSDTLNLFAACCDQYNYHLMRSQRPPGQ